MGIDGIGSSVIIALAAVLWFVYLVPTWLRRREYLATERNAVRLQQTVRIMAESAQIPAVVRIEATARSVATHEKALHREQQLAAAIERAQAVSSARAAFTHAASTHAASASVASHGDFAAGAPKRVSGAETLLASRRLRRSRLFTSAILLGALGAAGFGMGVLLATGAWALLAAAVAVAVGAVVLLGQMAAVAKARRELGRVVRATPVATPLHDQGQFEQPERQAGWTPVPLPKPLYLSRPAPASASSRQLGSAQSVGAGITAEFDHAAALRAAALEAERALRAAQASPEVTRLARPAAASRFASMGIVAQTDAVKTDLDDILRRRRAAG